MKVEEGEAKRMSDVHWIGRFRFAKIAGREPIKGYDGGIIPEFAEFDISSKLICVISESSKLDECSGTELVV